MPIDSRKNKIRKVKATKKLNKLAAEKAAAAETESAKAPKAK